MCPGAEGAHWEPLSYSLGSRHCSTCPGWGMEGLWSWALPSRSQCSVIPTGECHPAAVVDVLLCMGWDWWCRCPGEPGASLDNSMPVSCSAKPMCPSGSLHSIHCIHIQQPQPSAACPQELTAHPEPPVLKAWPPCSCVPRPVSWVVQTHLRLVMLLSRAAVAAAPALLHMSHPGMARGAVCARKRGTLMQFVAI